jgi:hypothetical protein
VRRPALLLSAVLLALLTGCNSASGESDEATMANRATALERAADQTTDATINQINEESRQTATETLPVSGSSAGKAKK